MSWFKAHSKAILVTFILGQILLVFFLRGVQLSRASRALSDQKVSLANSVSLQREEQKKTVYLPKIGDRSLGEEAQQDIPTLRKIFEEVTTFKSAKEYERNIDFAKKHIEGEVFYKDFLTDQTDVTGNSVVDALSLKSVSAGVEVFQNTEGTYTVIPRFIPYHASSDLNQKKILDQSAAFIVVKKIGEEKFQVDHLETLNSFDK